MGEEVDPAAEFLAREQSVLADLDDNYKEQKGSDSLSECLALDFRLKSIHDFVFGVIDTSRRVN